MSKWHKYTDKKPKEHSLVLVARLVEDKQVFVFPDVFVFYTEGQKGMFAVDKSHGFSSEYITYWRYTPKGPRLEEMK